MTTTRAAELWNMIAGDAGSPACRPVTDQGVRKLCREGTFERLGVEYQRMGANYLISRASLCLFLWCAGQDVCVRAESAAGIGLDRRHEIIVSVGAEHPGDGEAMDAIWRRKMRREFLMSGIPKELREA